MAIAKIEKVRLIIPLAQKERVLEIIQRFGDLELFPTDPEKLTSDGDIKEKEYSVSSEKIEKALNIISVWGSESSIAKLKAGRPNVSFDFLEERVSTGEWEKIADEIIDSDSELTEVRKKRADITKNVNGLYTWRNLRFYPGKINSSFRYLDVVTGRFASRDLEAFRADLEDGYIDVLFDEPNEKGVAVYFPKEKAKEVYSLCKQHDFVRFDYDREELPKELIEVYSSEEKKLVEREAGLTGRLKELYSRKEELFYADDYFSNGALRAKAGLNAEDTRFAVLLSGWIEKERTGKFRSLLKKSLDFPYYLSFEEVKDSDKNSVPTVLKNKRVVRAFEQLVEMYSLPRYDELDPTPMLAVFYLCFFGMMVADIGYGLVMLIATALIKLLFKPDRGLAKNIDMFFWLSFPVMIWGVIYGSFFGVDIHVGIFNPSKDIIDLIILSMVFGWIQMIVGLSMKFVNNVKNGQKVAAVGEGLSWVIVLLGLGAIVLSKTVFSSDILFYTGALMCAVAVIAVLVSPIITSKGHRIKGLMKGLYAIYGVTGYVSDLVSYSRLMSLGVAGASISVAFNTIIGTIPLVGRVTIGIFLAIAMHLLNMFLSLLSAYVHGIRLQYVEFFGKFYTGGGKKFSPLKAAEKHVYISEENDLPAKEK